MADFLKAEDITIRNTRDTVVSVYHVKYGCIAAFYSLGHATNGVDPGVAAAREHAETFVAALGGESAAQMSALAANVSTGFVRADPAKPAILNLDERKPL